MCLLLAGASGLRLHACLLGLAKLARSLVSVSMLHAFKDKSEYVSSFYAAVEKCLGEVACAKAAGGGDGEGQGRSGEDEAREEEAQASSLAEVAASHAAALAALSAAAAQVCARCLDLVAAAALPPRCARGGCCVVFCVVDSRWWAGLVAPM